MVRQDIDWCKKQRGNRKSRNSTTDQSEEEADEEDVDYLPQAIHGNGLKPQQTDFLMTTLQAETCSPCS